MTRDELIEQYTIYHRHRSDKRCEIRIKDLEFISKLNEKYNFESVLDYGCGHGKQYTVNGYHYRMKIPRFGLYDIAYPDWKVLPEGKFDLVICTDVLEHIPEGELLDEALHNIFNKANKYVYLKISTIPAVQVLSNGQNAHCTLKSFQEWSDILLPMATEKNVGISLLTGRDPN